MLPQIIHERERRRLTRKNGQRPCPCSHRAHEVRLPGSACQPEPGRQCEQHIRFGSLSTVFEDLGIAFSGTETALL